MQVYYLCILHKFFQVISETRLSIFDQVYFKITHFFTHVEDSVHVVSGRGILHTGRRSPAQHFVDRPDYFSHLCLADSSVSIHVVQCEHPLQFVLSAAAGNSRQYRKKLLEKDWKVTILNLGGNTFCLPINRNEKFN